MRIASYNVENLFMRPNALDPRDWSLGRPILEAYRAVNALMEKATYSAADKRRMRDLLVTLDIYAVNSHGAIRRKRTPTPRWAWLRANRGKFDREPADVTQSVEIVATGRDAWIGWVELASEPVDELSTQMTARVIKDVDADIIALVEAEDRPSLVRFNSELLDGMYRHVMLVDGNDERGIDVGVMTRVGFEIRAVRSYVDLEDTVGAVFSRDCADYAIEGAGGRTVHVLINHFKSQSGGGGSQRKRQAVAVREIVDALVARGDEAVVVGDFNEGPAAVGSAPTNLARLFEASGPLVDCYALPGFDVGTVPGTFDTCSIRNRLDYIFLTRGLIPAFAGGAVFRSGVWGQRVTRPTAWTTYQEIGTSHEQASDHSALYVDLNI